MPCYDGAIATPGSLKSVAAYTSILILRGVDSNAESDFLAVAAWGVMIKSKAGVGGTGRTSALASDGLGTSWPAPAAAIELA